MNEKYVIDKLTQASAGGDLVKIDSESADISFCFGVSGETQPPRWGNIAGDINNQTDLKTALDGKIEKTAGSPDIKFGCDDGGVFVDVGGVL